MCVAMIGWISAKAKAGRRSAVRRIMTKRAHMGAQYGVAPRDRQGAGFGAAVNEQHGETRIGERSGVYEAEREVA